MVIPTYHNYCIYFQIRFSSKNTNLKVFIIENNINQDLETNIMQTEYNLATSNMNKTNITS